MKTTRLWLGYRVPLYLAAMLCMQLRAADQVHFEAASVKKPDECQFHQMIDASQFVLQGVPLAPVLMTAFGVSKAQIIGPSWLESDCFDFVAKFPKDSTPDQFPVMIRALLAERFKLSAHKEDRSTTNYALVIDKGGPRLKQVPENLDKDSPPNGVATKRGGGGITGTMTMEMFAKALSTQGYGLIIDGTGLTGRYAIKLSWVSGQGTAQVAQSPSTRESAVPPATSDPDGADLFTALRKSLGLRLEPRKMQTEFLVVDHIERVPTQN